MLIDSEPILIQLKGESRPRELAYTMRTQIMLEEEGMVDAPMVERIEDDSKGNKQYRVRPRVLAAHLFACLQRDMLRTGERLTREQLEDAVSTSEEMVAAISLLNRAIDKHLGIKPKGEAHHPSEGGARVETEGHSA